MEVAPLLLLLYMMFMKVMSRRPNQLPHLPDRQRPVLRVRNLPLNQPGRISRTRREIRVTLEIRRSEDVATAIGTVKNGAQALYVTIDALVNTHRLRINTLALAAGLPTMHGSREHVEVGGLMSYGPNPPHLYRRGAELVDKILRGTSPGDIPVEQPTKFDLVINLITAKALGLEIPPTLLARADEVIE